MKISRIITTAAFIFSHMLVCGITESSAAPIFYSTDTPSVWSVATNVGGADGQLSSFNTSDFNAAVAIAGRPGFIANNSSGTNGGMGTWTFFVFRQTFDLSGYDAATADLKFQWAADDSGEVFAWRGSWIPKFSLNGGEFIAYPGSPTPTYSYSSVVDLSSGFVSGLNTIDFYVEGNGVTDGFALLTSSFTANESPTTTPVPEPGTIMLLGMGMLTLAVYGKRRMNK